MINELIEQIGGRERLQSLVHLDGMGCVIYRSGEVAAMARALLAVLDAQTSPVWGQARFKGGEWSSCSAEHVAMVMEKPAEWVNYECRYLYTAPPAASVPEPEIYTVAKALRRWIDAVPEGWQPPLPACRALIATG